MEVLSHIRPYFEGISPYIGLTKALHMVGTSNLGSWNGHWEKAWPATSPHGVSDREVFQNKKMTPLAVAKYLQCRGSDRGARFQQQPRKGQRNGKNLACESENHDHPWSNLSYQANNLVYILKISSQSNMFCWWIVQYKVISRYTKRETVLAFTTALEPRSLPLSSPLTLTNLGDSDWCPFFFGHTSL